MNSSKTGLIRPIFYVIIYMLVVLSFVVPDGGKSHAQETTPEPPPEITPATVETTPEPIIAPEETTEPIVETTSEPIAETTAEPIAEITSEPIGIEIPNPFSEDFSNWDSSSWLIAGWELATEEGNNFLATQLPNATASILNPDWANILLQARLRVTIGDTAAISLRVSDNAYRVLFDGRGNARLYRGAELLYSSPVTENAQTTAEPVWMDIQIQAYNAQILVFINGAQKIAYTDPIPLTTGLIIFSSGESNSGVLALDEVVVTRLDAPVLMATPTSPEIIATPPAELTVEPETTPEITAEPETTLEPEITAEPETTLEPEITAEPETTLEPITVIEDALLSENFEDESYALEVGRGTSVVSVADGKALLMTSGGSTSPVEPIVFSDAQISGRITFLTAADDARLSLYFRESANGFYEWAIGPSGTTLHRHDSAGTTILGASAGSIDPNNTLAFSISANGSELIASLDDSAVITATDVNPLPEGTMRLALNGEGTLTLDDIRVTAITEETPVTATPAPLTLTPEVEAKLLSSTLSDLINLGDDTDAINTLIAERRLITDEFGRIEINIYPAEGASGEQVASTVELTGGHILFFYSDIVRAFVPVNALLPLAHASNIKALQIPMAASPTGPEMSGAHAPAGSVSTEAFDLLGIQDWHAAGILGAGVRIGVIDVGFAGLSTSDPETPSSCLSDATPPTGVGSSDHGVNMVEVICDIAPQADVFVYRANDVASLYNAIIDAQNDNMKIIVIGLDLGAAASPGDGTLGYSSATNPYQAITSARNSGIVVIAAAGNNGNNKYRTYNYTGGGASINFTGVEAGGYVYVSWNNWGSGGLTVNATGISPSETSPGLSGRQFGPCIVNPSETTCSGEITIAGGGSFLVQVQVTSGSLGATTGSITQNTATGTLARPADSSDIIAVGAVCYKGFENFPLLPDSSFGPRFGPGGTAPTVNENNLIKPEVLGPSLVSTSLIGSTVEGDGCNPSAPLFEAFGGTSAAAAHVAGMAALLIASDNDEFNAFLLSNSTAVREIKRYMMTHSADMPFGDASGNPYIANCKADSANIADDCWGWDMQFGAGLFIIGEPDYLWTQAINPTTDASGVDLDNVTGNDCTADFIYVGQGAPFIVGGSANGQINQDGTKEKPFASIAQAANLADEAGDCVVVMPGEYVTPLRLQNIPDGVIITSYREAAGLEFNPTHLRAVAGYINADGYRSFTSITECEAYYPETYCPDEPPKDPPDKAPYPIVNSINPGAIYYDGVTNVAFNGFIIDGALVTNSGIFSPPNVVTFNRANNSLFSNNILDGWSVKVPQIYIPATTPETTGVRIENNTFSNNTSLIDAPTNIDVYIAGSLTAPIIIKNNIFDTNRGGNQGNNLWIPATIRSRDSYISILSNVFIRNEGETIIQTITKEINEPHETRILGNLFQENVVEPQGTADDSGPLVNLFYNANFYFINNSVIANNVTQSGSFSAIIGRGNNNILSAIGSLGSNEARWEIHNNLFYNNTVNGPLVKDLAGSIGNEALCRHIGDATPPPSGNGDDLGATYNWFFGNIWLGFGACEYVIEGPNGNTLDDDPNGFFLGQKPGVQLDNEWEYYALAYDQNDVPSPGIDAGNNNVAGGGIVGVAPFDRDVSGQTRLTDGDLPPDNIDTVDIGAFEFSPIRINFNDPQSETCCLIVGPFLEDGGPTNAIPFVIDLGPYVEGGFGELSYRIDDKLPGITEFPLNYGTYCGPQFAGTRGLVINGSIASYCPPRHFYTDNGEPTVPDYVRFTFTVQDASGASATGEVRFNINPQPDSSISGGVIGDATPSSNDLFEVSVNIDTTLTSNIIDVQLRPFVRFNNFFFSERGNNEFANRVQYPFTYSFASVSDPSGILNATPSINPTTGVMTIDLKGVPGAVTIFYNVTDDDGGNSTNNRLTVNAISRVPVAGLHDDTSFAFEYDNTTLPTNSWDAINSPNNINNTLHITRALNDRAKFAFIGKGFVLYMQPSGTGSWTLEIDGVTIDQWQPSVLPDRLSTVQPVAFPGVTCTTQAKAELDRIFNAGSASYTVTCNGFTDERHDIEIINREAKLLQVDAFSIIRDVGSDDILQPGFHDVDEDTFINVFDAAGWTELFDTRMSNRLARVRTTSGGNVEFFIRNATGFALGTVLEVNGAQYDICVEGVNPVVPKVCQRYDNSFGASNSTTYNVFRPFWGLETETLYSVTLENITVPSGGRAVFDSLVVFDIQSSSVLDLGSTEDDAVGPFVLANGLEDSWLLDANSRTGSNGSVTNLAKGIIAAGPFIGFRVPSDADTIYWQRTASTRDSSAIMICVDRALGEGATNNAGNCIIANLKAKNDDITSVKYQRVEADGTLTDVTNTIINPVPSTIVIEESLFREAWSGLTEHKVEIFSLTNEPWNLDRVIVLSSDDPLVAGEYEEFTRNLLFFDEADLTTPIEPTYNIDNPGNFVYRADRTTTRASGGGFVATDGLDDAIFFSMEGVGFAPRFRLDNKADAVNICWVYDPGGTITDADGVLNNPSATCQIFDNQNSRATENVARSILTLKQGRYAVAIQSIGDNFEPSAHVTSALPITMVLDGVTIYDADYDALSLLVPGSRYEGNYLDRENSDNFIYFGRGWSHVTGSRATAYSASNYDTIRGVAGAGIVFKTDEADAIVLYRSLSNSSAPILVCAAEDTGGPTYINQKCSVVSNTGSGTQKPYVFYLTDDPFSGGTPGTYIVSISTLSDAVYIFDAIEPVDVQALTPGIYDDSAAGIIYDASYENLILDGDMEVGGYWTATSTAIAQSTLRFTGRNSIVATNAPNGSTVNSAPLDLVDGETYTAIARVYVTSGEVRMQMTGVPEFGTSPTSDGITGKWVTLRQDFTATADHANVSLQIAPNGVTSTFNVDDVYLINGGRWSTITRNGTYGNTISQSQTHGATIQFAITNATGFEIGTQVDRDGGEYEVCYGTSAQFMGGTENCFVFQNETNRANSTTSRSFANLNPSNTYQVIIRDVEDGFTVLTSNTTTIRRSANLVGKVALDFVRVWNQTSPDVVPAGTYNDNANMQFLPAESWLTVVGRTASRYSGETYTTVVDANGRTSRSLAGQIGILNIGTDTFNAPATIILDTYSATSSNSDQLLACVGSAEGKVVYDGAGFSLDETGYDTDGIDNCTLVDMRSSSKLIFNSGNLPLLGNTSADRIFTFRTLTAGPVIIDGYQVLYGTSLTEGYFEEAIGFSDDGTQVITLSDNNHWTLTKKTTYSGGFALVTTTDNATLSFEFTGSGISIITQGATTGGTVDISINGPFNYTFDNISTVGSGTMALTFAGLAQGTYTVTLTADITGNQSVTVDAIEVYGALELLGSLYDDNEKTASGELVLKYGPSISSWTFFSGSRANGFLNQTYHQTAIRGGTVSFRTTNANSIAILHSSRSTSTAVEVCWTNEATGARTCETFSPAGQTRYTSNSPTPNTGTYSVSITNLVAGKNLQLDAIQILEGDLAEGIYDIKFLDELSPSAFSPTPGSWTLNTAQSTAVGLPGARMRFSFDGIGMSIILNESTSSGSNQYTVCISTNAAYTPCDVVNEVVSIAGNGERSLSYMGLHDGAGNDDTYYVTLDNSASNGKNITVKGVHILGADPSLEIADTEQYENTVAQIQYFPFGMMTEVIARSGPSGLSQHIGRTRGSGAYFEFDNFSFDSNNGTEPGFEYVRELSSRYGNVRVCYGEIGGTNTTAGRTTNLFCETPISNNGRVYQGATPFNPADNGITCTNGCWVFIENLDGKDIPIDFVRLFDTTLPILNSGYYNETHPYLSYDGTFATISDTKASGGTVARTTTVGDGMFFFMYGSGFSVHFTAERDADLVNICAVRYNPNDVSPDPMTKDDIMSNPAFAANRICQSYDNERTSSLYNIGRTTLGIEPNYYAVAVEMGADNFLPAPHTTAIGMEIDGITIYNDGFEWINTTTAFTNTDFLNVLTTGTRYEPSFATTSLDKNFLYIGAWTSVSGTKARLQSGTNYDEIKQFGGGVVFRTDNANALTLYRNAKKDNAPILVCAAPMVDTDGGGGFAWEANLSQQTCAIIYNDSGTGTAQPISFQFNQTGNTGPHVVSITTLSAGSFIFDALELGVAPDINSGSGVNALTPGLYESTDAGIFYNQSFINLLPAGNMELGANDARNDGLYWDNISDSAPDTHASGNTRFEGRFSRQVVGNKTEGIEYAEDITFLDGQTYTIIARVFVRKGKFAMQLADDPTIIAETTTTFSWETLRINYRPVGGDLTTRLQFVVTAVSKGVGEAFIDDVQILQGGRWTQVFGRYSNGNYMESASHGAEALFQFTGGGFEVGTIYNAAGGEVRICYGDPTDYPDNWPTNANCFTYQHEASKAVNTASHIVAGLPLDTYLVSVTDVEDGYSVLARNANTLSRASRYPVGKMALDYIRIFDDSAPPLVSGNQYEDYATDANNDTYLQFFPQNRWSYFSGTTGRGYSGNSFAAIVDDNIRVSSNYPGATARLDIEVPATVGNVNVTIYTGKPGKRTTDLLLVCAMDNIGGVINGGVIGELKWDLTNKYYINPDVESSCTIVKTLQTDAQFTVSANDIPLLISDNDEDKVITLLMQPLNAGEFRIDGYQIMFGDRLAPGLHDEFLPESLLDFEGDLIRTGTCNNLTQWCLVKNTRAYGGSVAETRGLNNTLSFNLRGTGFSIITNADTRGVNFRVCYKLASSALEYPAIGGENPAPNISNGEIYCENLTTDTTASDWNAVTPDRTIPRSGSQYGFAFYGLPLNDYSVEVRVVDNTIASSDKLQIDAVAVFGDVTAQAPLIGGMYDDTESRLLYEPFPFWSVENTSRNGPPKGPYNKTEHAAVNAGTIMQARVDGNQFILYQTIDTRNSNEVRICLTVTSDVVHCGEYGETDIQALQVSEFSQNGKRVYFTPVVFYGLGDGAHPIIFENRSHGQRMSIDALFVPED